MVFSYKFASNPKLFYLIKYVISYSTNSYLEFSSLMMTRFGERLEYLSEIESSGVVVNLTIGNTK